MNLNYSNIRLEDFSESVIQKYQFPQDKEVLRRFVRGDSPNISREEVAQYLDQVKWDGFTIMFSLAVGVISYCYLLMPGGKVIRDRYDASLPPARRFLRRAVPFLGLAYPIYLYRNRMSQTNGYTPN